MKSAPLITLIISLSFQQLTCAQDPSSTPYNLQSGEGEINGIAYRISPSNWRASFAGSLDNPLDLGNYWEIYCRKDAITDQKSCSIQRKTLTIIIKHKQQPFLYVGEDHYPFKPTTIRVDSNKPLHGTIGSDGDFSSNSISIILKQMVKGQSITTRYYEWPYDYSKTDTFPLAGFNEAMTYAKWALTQTNGYQE